MDSGLNFLKFSKFDQIRRIWAGISSILKIVGSEVQQGIATLTMEAVGSYAAPYLPESLGDSWNGEPIGPDYAAHAMPYYFFRRKASIYGGSNEIMKELIAREI